MRNSLQLCRFLSIVIILFLTSNVSLNAGIQHLLPKPQQISEYPEETAVQLQKVNITSPYHLTDFNDWLVNDCGADISSETENVTFIQVNIVSNITGADPVNEAYSINIKSGKITITAVSEKAVYWALQTLIQLADGEKGNKYLTACNIVDWPAFRVRGYMHDTGRSFIEFEELKKQIALLSRYKINVFHWHLTENQGWRLESKLYPQLNSTSNYTRHPGKYYTIAQAKELVEWCKKHEITLIPEIDMPGHSDAFTRAFGYNMQTTQGLATLKSLMTEICDVFSGTEWMHIGTDEVKITLPEFVPEMVTHIRSLGKKVVSWNPGYSYTNTGIDMIQMWSSSGKPLAGVPTIDSRYHYINHFDQFADIVGIYNSSIAGQTKGSADYAGVIMCVWNDRIVKSDADIINQNAFYASILAVAERSWIGGGTYITTKGTLLNAPYTNDFIAFADWERRFLYHKENHLLNEPISYVKQTNVQWRITDAFPNGGVLTTVFPPETQIADSYTYGDKTYGSKKAYGAGVYLRHVWGTMIPSFYSAPATNSTAYAYTYIYSPEAQQAGALIEFQNYGRSESDLAAPAGKWDYRESRIWLNDIEIPAPVWQNTHTTKSNEIPLANENFTARPPVNVQLKQGWNKVFMKLPVGAFSTSAVRLQKWMFTFVLVSPDGKKSMDNIIYSPEMNLNPSSEVLTTAIDEVEGFVNGTQTGTQPGLYPIEAKNDIKLQIAEAKAFKLQQWTVQQYDSVIAVLNQGLSTYKKSINLPLVSDNTLNIWYTLHTLYRDNRYITSYGQNINLKGDPSLNGAASQLWKFVRLSDGTLSIVNKLDKIFINSESSYNTAIKGSFGTQTANGWSLTPTYTGLTFAITSGAVQLNQTNSGLSYQIYNWGSGSNLTDTGCRYQITEVERILTDINPVNEKIRNFTIYDRKIILNDQVKFAELFHIDGRKINLNEPLVQGIYILKADGQRHKIYVY